MKKTISAFMILILTASLFAASAAALPDKYRTDAETPVLNQKNNPLCWAYAGADMLSIAAVKSGQAPSGSSVFSAPMMARAEFDGNEHRISRENVWNKCYGSLDYALFAGVSGKGLLPDAAYPSVGSASAAPVSALYGRFAYIDRFVERDISELQRRDRTAKLKEWIAEYGAVSCDAFIGDYNNVTHVARTLSFDNSKPSHQLLLVGWDDTKYTDTGTGAFIMKNSWGTGWGDGGYAYISYNTEFGRVAYAASVKIDSDARVLTHTEVDFLSGNHTSDKTLYGAVNVFTANEKLTVTAAGIYTSKPGSVLEAKLFVNLKDPSAVGTAKPDAAGTLTVTDAGYYSVSLDSEPTVKKGDTVTLFATVHANGNYYVYSEYSDPDYELAVTSSAPGQSYAYVGGELKKPSGDYIGTVICRAEHKDSPPVTEPVTAPLTGDETECVHEFSEWVVISEGAAWEPKTCMRYCLKCGERETAEFPPDETEPGDSGADQTETDVTEPVVIIPGNQTDEPSDVTLDLGTIGAAAGRVIKVILIAALAVIALIVLFVILAVAASKKTK